MTKKINSLTKAQEALFPEFVRRWIEIGLCSDPANRPEAERGIKLIYKTLGLKEPQIIWCNSPIYMFLRKTFFQQFLKNQKINKRIENKVRDEILSEGADQVSHEVENKIWHQVWNEVRNKVWNEVLNEVGHQVWNELKTEIGNKVWKKRFSNIEYLGYGQYDASWLCFYDYFREVCGLTTETSKLEGLCLIAKNAGWFYPFEGICWICERHSFISKDERGRLHNPNGPALLFPDGWAIYRWHGIRIPPEKKHIIEEPALIKCSEIDSEENVEVRRIMIERYGQTRYLQDSNAEKIHEDDFGILYRKEINNDESLVMVKVVNSTPEPDGSYKDYFLRVPPHMKTAHEAVAWTFDISKEDYSPVIQT